MQRTLRTTSFAVALLSMAMHAQAAPLISAQGGISNFRIVLTDLAPHDGIAPEFTYLPIAPTVHQLGATRLYISEKPSNLFGLNGQPRKLIVPGQPLATDTSTSVSTAGLQASASIESGSMRTGVAFNENDVLSIATTPPSSNAEAWGTWLGSTAEALGRFTLSANTRVEFFATSALETTINQTALTSLLNERLLTANRIQVAAESNWDAAIWIAPQGDFAEVDFQQDRASSGFDFSKPALHPLQVVSNYSASNQVRFSWDNTDDFTQEANLDLTLNSYARVSVDGVTPAVPEVNTITLQLTGIATVAACMRSRRRTHQKT